MSHFERLRAIERANLTLHEAAILTAIERFADRDGICWPSTRAISTRAKVGERTVQAFLARLKKVGLLTCTRWHQNGRRMPDLKALDWERLPKLDALEAAQRTLDEPLLAGLPDADRDRTPCGQTERSSYAVRQTAPGAPCPIQMIELSKENSPTHTIQPVCVDNSPPEKPKPSATPSRYPVDSERQLINAFFTSLHGSPPTIRQPDPRELTTATSILDAVAKLHRPGVHATPLDAALDLARVVGATCKAKFPDLQRFTAAATYFDAELARRQRISRSASAAPVNAFELAEKAFKALPAAERQRYLDRAAKNFAAEHPRRRLDRGTQQFNAIAIFAADTAKRKEPANV